MAITQQQLTDIIKPTNFSPDKIKEITDSLNQTFDKYEINTPLRMCHFLAQVLLESGKFKYTSEIWGPTAAQKKYEGRLDLGNDQPGDGYKYRGRGWIQLTGKANYKAASKDLGQDFVANPDLVQQYPWAAVVSGWYWKKRSINNVADNDDVTAVTKKVNGGLNGFTERKNWLTKAKAVLISKNILPSG